MSVSSAREVAQFLVANFPLDASMTAQEATEWALRGLGRSDTAAFAEADEHIAHIVLRLMQEDPAAHRRLTISARDPERLIGNLRTLATDDQERRREKGKAARTGELLDAIHALGNQRFEMLCAGGMSLSGAEAHAICSGDEGGIDVYGRIRLRPTKQGSVLLNSLLDRPVFFLGQAKCIRPSASLGPGEVRELSGAVDLCLKKYEGAQKLPSHRVPSDYYVSQETCLRLLFTTGHASDKAIETARSLDIIVITGWQLAEYLASHDVGLVLEESGWRVDHTRLTRWAETFNPRPALDEAAKLP